MSRGRGLAGWPVQRKLIALVALPLAIILTGFGVLVTGSLSDLAAAQRSSDLATLVTQVNSATGALQNERRMALAWVRDPNATSRARLDSARKDVDAALGALTTTLGSGELPTEGPVADAADLVAEVPDDLVTLRTQTTEDRQPQVVFDTFVPTFDALTSLSRVASTQLRTASSDAETGRSAELLAALIEVGSAASGERDLTTLALESGSISLEGYNLLSDLQSEQRVQLQVAGRVADETQLRGLRLVVADDVRLDRFRRDLTTLLTTEDDVAAGNPTAFATLASARIDSLTDVVAEVANDLGDAADSAVQRALLSAGAAVLTALVVLGLVAFATVAVARTVTRPLAALRRRATEIATVQLPQTVRRIEADGPGAARVELPSALPEGTQAGPETVEVARAVDGLTRTAVDLAGSQVTLRRALDEAFVTMSRRSQSMVERQLAVIDELESQEQDPEQLRNLFRLDHLAARMRRYNDNLLVLAGSPLRTRSTVPVSVSEVFRAATSEMEHYERVRLQPVSGSAVAGPVAGGLVHLLAELLDNAATYSSPTSPIELSAAFTPDGGLVIEVSDSGVGIAEPEIQKINARLAEPEDQNATVPSKMGLFVVGRLARRGGFRVRLRPRDGVPGLVAVVSVPARSIVGSPGVTGELPTQLQATVQHTGQATAQATGQATVRPGDRDATTTLPAVPPVATPVLRSGLPQRSAAAPQPSDAGSGLPRRVPQGSGAGGSGGTAAAGATRGGEPFGPPIPAPDTVFTPLIPTDAAQAGSGRGRAFDALGGRAEALGERAEQPGPLDAESWIAPALGDRDRTDRPLTDDLHFDRPDKPVLNGFTPTSESGTGLAPSAWDDALPTELAAQAAASARLAGYRPSDPSRPMIGDDSLPDLGGPTPIFDSISAWFAPDPAADPTALPTPDAVIDLRDSPAPAPDRWASLGDDAWQEASRRASAAPAAEGETSAGLPRRRPGANLVNGSAATHPTTHPTTHPPAPPAQPSFGSYPTAEPSAAPSTPLSPSGLPMRTPSGAGSSIAGGWSSPPPASATPRSSTDAEAVRGRLGSYQRGLSTARQARRQALAAGAHSAPPTVSSTGLFGTTNPTENPSAGDSTGEQEGEK